MKIYEKNCRKFHGFPHDSWSIAKIEKHVTHSNFFLLFISFSILMFVVHYSIFICIFLLYSYAIFWIILILTDSYLNTKLVHQNSFSIFNEIKIEIYISYKVGSELLSSYIFHIKRVIYIYTWNSYFNQKVFWCEQRIYVLVVIWISYGFIIKNMFRFFILPKQSICAVTSYHYDCHAIKYIGIHIYAYT